MPFCRGASPCGARIFYSTSGSPSAPHRVVFVMGLGGDHGQWEPQTNYFNTRADTQCVVLDNRGIGFSDPVGGRWTTRDMAKDVLRVLDHLGWHQRVHIVGLSMGGMISQELALLGPLHRFASLTLISTIAGGLRSLGYFALSLPTGIRTLASTFLSSSPSAQLDGGLRLLYPAPFLARDGAAKVNAKTGATEVQPNYTIFRRALIARGRQSRAAGMKPPGAGTLAKQALAVATHRVSAADLRRIGRHFGDAVVVLTGDADILVHAGNASVLAGGIKVRAKQGERRANEGESEGD
jgi:pimeloyl-ACP methyl ester carboxylesterase